MQLWFLLSVVSFCTTSNYSSNSVYIDSSFVPIYQNITCFCTIDVKGKVNVTVPYLESMDQLQTSFNNNTFTNLSLNSINEFGTGVVVLRYTTNEQQLTSLCLRLEGNTMTVSCKRPIKDTVVTDLGSTTAQHIGNANNH